MSDDTKHDYADYMEWRERVLMPYLAAALGNVRPLEGGSRQAATFIAEEAANNAWNAALASRCPTGQAMNERPKLTAIFQCEFCRDCDCAGTHEAHQARITELESSLTSARDERRVLREKYDLRDCPACRCRHRPGDNTLCPITIAALADTSEEKR